MFAKVLLIILAAGAIACCLLAIRQERIEAAHRMWQTHRRIAFNEQTLWELRAQIVRNCRPAEVRQLIAAAGGIWVSIPSAPPRIGGDVRLADSGPQQAPQRRANAGG